MLGCTENIIRSRKKPQKVTYYESNYIRCHKKHIHGDRKQISGPQGLGVGKGMRSDYLTGIGFPGSDENVELESRPIYTTL